MASEELVSNIGRPGSLKTLWSGKNNFQVLLEIAHPGAQTQYTRRATDTVCQIQPGTDFRF